MSYVRTEERVANGVKFLDEKYPGWEKQIVISVLDFSNPAYTILAHLFETDERGIEHLGLSQEEAVMRGLAFSPMSADGVLHHELNASWKKIIKERYLAYKEGKEKEAEERIFRRKIRRRNG